MNYFTLFPLQGYWGKFVGLAISTVALGVLAIQKFAGPGVLPLDMPEGKLLGSTLWLFALGLYILSFSKEKIDDERVKQVRYTALRCLSYCCLIGPFCFFAPFALDANGVSQGAIQDPITMLAFLLVFPLLAYQLIFNIGLYFSPQWVYNDLGAEENIRKNPKAFLIYIVLTTVLFICMILLNR